MATKTNNNYIDMNITTKEIFTILRTVIHPSKQKDLVSLGMVQELEINGDIRLDSTGTATTNGLCHSGSDSDTTFTVVRP